MRGDWTETLREHFEVEAVEAGWPNSEMDALDPPSVLKSSQRSCSTLGSWRMLVSTREA